VVIDVMGTAVSPVATLVVGPSVVGILNTAEDVRP
jgi:hypothetical protein